MVKTRVLILIGCLVTLFGCGFLRRSEQAKPEVLQIAKGRLGSDVSLVRAGDDLVAVYSAWETTGLYAVEIPVSDHLPAVPPSSMMIDRIDLAPPLSSSFGDHMMAAQGDTVTILYLAHAADDKTLLKVATHGPGADAWLVDALEPPGNPVAVIPASRDHVELFWAAGPLLHVSYPGPGQPDSLFAPFTPARKASTFGLADQSGMTVYDSISRALLVFRWNGYAWNQTKIDGAGPVNSSLLLADGRLAILSWDPGTRRLELFVAAGDASSSPSRTLVTMCEGTNAVALLPPAASSAQGLAPGQEAGGTAPRGDGLLFLYDDARPVGGGKLLHTLSLLSPGSGWGPAARRYHRLILTSGNEPITGFSAVEVADALYVLVQQDGLKLLRLKLPG